MKKFSGQWGEGPTPHPKGTYKSPCVAKINEEELLVMGGWKPDEYGKKVFKYNVINKEWTRMHDLMIPRFDHACVLFQDGLSDYVLVAGGNSNDTRLADTELYFLNGTVVKGKPMNKARSWFSLNFVRAARPKVYAIGGKDEITRLNDIEVWDSTQTWKYTSMRMMSKRNGYGSVAVPKSMLPQCGPKK